MAVADDVLASFNAADPATQWRRFEQLLWFDEGLGIWLDVSRMDMGPAQLQELRPRFAKAFEAMAALEAGAIANPDEQRQVGHYWLRQPELAPDPQAGQHIQQEIQRIDQFGAAICAGSLTNAAAARFTDVLWIGIGGSGLGPLLITRALRDPARGLPFHFFDNVDPDGFSRTLAGLAGRLATTLVVVVSK